MRKSPNQSAQATRKSTSDTGTSPFSKEYYRRDIEFDRYRWALRYDNWPANVTAARWK